eukprot:TRINITY_DN15093_c0_g1_i1.p1 TRINITY_DN15093_c0_g1~~TRINITY_DN15093_c0_g1_i1.p1  ORF type:complete len:336 (+),score=41.79 TRINITY_DN15093_c0_g1_i1:161-1168(+)
MSSKLGPRGKSQARVGSASGRPQDKGTVPEELDIYSEQFDALKALTVRDPGIPLPLLVKPLDNVYKCRFLLPKSDPEYVPLKRITHAKTSTASLSATSARASSPSPAASSPASTRGSTASPASKPTSTIASTTAKPSTTSGAKAKVTRLQSIADTFEVGPFSLLHRSVTKHTRISVAVRRVSELRGMCVGFLTGFDKHMNLIMSDVDETFSVYQRAAMTKVPGSDAPPPSQAELLALIPKFPPGSLSEQIRGRVFKVEIVERRRRKGDRPKDVQKTTIDRSRDPRQRPPTTTNDQVKTTTAPRVFDQLFRVHRRRHANQLIVKGDTILYVSPATS